MIELNLDIVTTGFATGYTTETVQFAVARKIDGTNWRPDEETNTGTVAGDNAEGFSIDLAIGAVDVTEQVRVEVIRSAETPTSGEFPDSVKYDGLEPAITPVAAA